MFICLILLFAPAIMVIRSTFEAIKDGMENGWDKHSAFMAAMWVAMDAIVLAAYVASAISAFSE